MRCWTSFEHKLVSSGFVLTTLLGSMTVWADNLPPPPPPPPGASPVPTRAPGTNVVLDPPPPAPPEIPGKTNSQEQPPKPPTPPVTQQEQAAEQPSASSIPGLAGPPPPPAGVDPRLTAPKKPRKRQAATPSASVSPAQPRPVNTWSNAPTRPEQTSRTKWYGWQSLIGVVPAQITLAVGIATDSAVAMAVGGLGTVFVSPIVHWSNRQTGNGWLSLLGNTGSMLIGGLAGDEVGVSVAVALWSGIDIAFLQSKEVTAEPKKAKGLGISSFAVVPMMDRGRQGLSIVGQF